MKEKEVVKAHIEVAVKLNQLIEELKLIDDPDNRLHLLKRFLADMAVIIAGSENVLALAEICFGFSMNSFAEMCATSLQEAINISKDKLN